MPSRKSTFTAAEFESRGLVALQQLEQFFRALRIPSIARRHGKDVTWRLLRFSLRSAPSADPAQPALNIREVVTFVKHKC